jgi:hypothetical protein
MIVWDIGTALGDAKEQSIDEVSSALLPVEMKTRGRPAA